VYTCSFFDTFGRLCKFDEAGYSLVFAIIVPCVNCYNMQGLQPSRCV